MAGVACNKMPGSEAELTIGATEFRWRSWSKGVMAKFALGVPEEMSIRLLKASKGSSQLFELF